MPQPASPLNETNLARIATMVVAAPVLCGLAGLAVLTLLKHRQAALVARYAAWHLAPVPIGPSYVASAAVPSLLAGSHGAQLVFVRNPAQWNDDMAFISFFVASVVLIAGTALVYGLATGRRALLFSALVPLAGIAWLNTADIGLFISGQEIALDPAANALTVNGHRVAALTDVRFLAGEKRSNGRNSTFHLSAVLYTGDKIEIGGPDVPANIAGASPALERALKEALTRLPAAVTGRSPIKGPW